MNEASSRPTASGLADALLAHLRDGARTAFEATPVYLAYVYGSRVWGIPRPDSDLDVGYYIRSGTGSGRLTVFEELRIAGLLAEAVGCEVDLRHLADAPLALRGRVLEEGHRIYCTDEVARVNLERDLLAQYHDYKPELEALRRLRLTALASRGG